MADSLANSLRDLYAERLRKARVDCFTLYVQDQWQPNVVTPHEVDPHLFYPEPMHAGPPREFHEFIAKWFRDAQQNPGDPRKPKDWRHGSISGLNCRFVDDAANFPRVSSADVADDYPTHGVLFRGFHSREDIRSVAAFSQRLPVEELSSDRELELRPQLFLNFRRKQVFDDPMQRWELGVLANDMINSAVRQEANRREHWQQPLLRTMQAHSDFLQLIGSEVLSRPRAELGDLYGLLASRLRERLAREDERMIVSIYTREARNGRDVLVNRGSKGEEGRPQREEQPLFIDSEASITVCTTISGRSHLLQFVPPEGHITVALSRREYRALKRAQETMPGHVRLAKGTQRVGGGWVLAPRDVQAQDLSRESTWLQIAGCNRIVPHLAARRVCDFSSMFGELDSEWVRPCSEACVPILVARQCLGCVNIESDRPARFNPALLNVLMNLATLVGTLVVREMDIKVSRAASGLALAVHGSDSMDRADSEGSFAHTLLDDYAREIASATMAHRVNIMGNEQPSLGFELIAASDRNWYLLDGIGPGPRPNIGYTERIRLDDRSEFRGIVIDIAYADQDDRQSTFDYVTYDILEQIDPDSGEMRLKGRPSSTVELLLKPGADQSPGPRLPKVQPKDEKIKQLVGLRIDGPGDPELGSARSCVGVVWFAFRRQQFVCPRHEDVVYDRIQAAAVLGQLLDIAQKCTLATQMRRSQTLHRWVLDHDIRHAGENRASETSRAHLMGALQSLQGGDLDKVRDELETVLLLHEHVEIQKLAAGHWAWVTGTSGSDVEWRSDVDILLGDLLDECWRAASTYIRRRNAVLEWGSDELLTHRVRIHPHFGRALFGQVFMNSLRYSPSGRVTVHVSEEKPVSSDSVSVRITNRCDQVKDSTRKNLELIERGAWTVPLTKSGRGLSLIHRYGDAPATSEGKGKIGVRVDIETPQLWSVVAHLERASRTGKDEHVA